MGSCPGAHEHRGPMLKVLYCILTGEKITITGPPDRNGMVYGYKRTRLKLKKKKGLFQNPNVLVYDYVVIW
jgi:hypothetical protein